MKRIIIVVLATALAGGAVFTVATTTQAQPNYYGEVTWIYDGYEWVRSAGPTYEQRITALEVTVTELKAKIEELTESMDSMTTATPTTGIRAQPEPSELSSPPQLDVEYYIRTNASSYGLGDIVHFEAKIRPCPAPIYGLDGTTIVEHGGFNNIDLLKQDPTTQKYQYEVEIVKIWCNSQFEPSAWSYANTVTNHTNDGSKISGHFEVTGSMQSGNYELRAVGFRNSFDANSTSAFFTLG